MMSWCDGVMVDDVMVDDVMVDDVMVDDVMVDDVIWMMSLHYILYNVCVCVCVRTHCRIPT